MRKFANMQMFIPAILGILGLKEWKTNEDKKQILDAEDTAKLKAVGFTDDFLIPFAQALEHGFEDEQGEAVQDSTALAVMKGLLAKTTLQLANANTQLEALQKAEGDHTAAISAKDEEIKGLHEKIAALSALEEPDRGAGAGITQGQAATGVNLQDENQLMGMQGVMFALDRPYNQRARAALLARQGVLVQTRAESSIDYGTLKADLGAFYEVRWQDRLQSFLLKLPSLEAIFPVESGYQDLATLVNIWLGEFSQAENTGSDFDKVVKGNYEFDDETIRMYSVMFAHKFRDLKQLEKTWIGYLNREGSQAIKWSFIEYILVETAKKLHNEREQRRINGVRREPDLNKPGRAMDGSDGLYEFLRKKVDGFMDLKKEKVVYQIKPFELGEITIANIGEKFYQGTSMIPAVLRDSGQLVLYIPSYMLVWYHKYNELHYGQNQDYKADMQYVKEYPSVRIVTIPNADNHQRIFWTMEGNINCYEHVPGEMYNFSLEQQDWTLKVWSIWKESIWARAVGFKYTNKADMDYTRQMIFCNEYDRPASDFIDGEKDKNPNVSQHTSVQTVANSTPFGITDIEGAEVGRAVAIKCGSTDKGVSIQKAGKFELISSAWNPNKGDIIRLMKRADGKFIELGRETAVQGLLKFPADSTTPSLKGSEEFVTDANSQATAITNFKDATDGVVYTIHGNGSEHASTIANSGNFVLTAAMKLEAGKFIRLVKSGAKFYEVERG